MRNFYFECKWPQIKNVFRYIFIIKFLILISVLEGVNLSALGFVDDMQQLKITGTIADESGNPMVGVNIQVEGSTLGVISDVNGKYSIEVPDRNAVLIFSFIGYTPQRTPVEGRTVLDLTMVPDTKALEEVVVIGYGTQKKVNVIGSVTTVSTEELNAAPVSMVSNALAGRMAGAIVQQGSGEPGNNAAVILIRGKATLGNNSPLVVVDGIPGRDM